MSATSVRFRTAATTTAVAVVLLTIGLERPTAGSPSARAVPLNVLLTVSTNLPSVARTVLAAEAERIWRSEGVDIEWSVPGLASDSSDAPLRVMVVSRPNPNVRSTTRWPVAELIPEASPRALAIASITGAERVVAEAARSAALASGAPADYRLGLVLGRAVAHEIGHFLLATATHAQSGLMRASVDAREFTTVGGETFRLDREASQWLRQRLSASSATVTTLRAGGFSYTRGVSGEEAAGPREALLQADPAR